jgi:MFS family permease
MIVRKVWFLAASTTLVVTSFAMFGPVLAVLLQQRGYSTTLIGAFAMIPFACVALLIPIMPRVFARFGMGRCYLLGLVLEMTGTLGYTMSSSFSVWCASAVAGGIGAAAAWNATEALLAQYAPPDQRGHVMGLYQTALGAALAAGPFIPAVLHWPAQTTLVVAAVVQFAALGLTWASGIARPQPEAMPINTQNDAGASVNKGAARLIGGVASHASPMHTTGTMGTWQALCAVPYLVGIAFVGGVFEAGLSSISAANGASLGLSMGAAASIVGVLGLGSFLFQYPAGMAADKFAPRHVFTTAGAVLLLSVVLLAWGTQPATPPDEGQLWVLWVSALVWGGVGGALYTLTMIRVAHHFNSASVAAGTAAMITGYTLGGAVGPVVSGVSLQYAGTLGLSLWLGALALAVIVLARRSH